MITAHGNRYSGECGVLITSNTKHFDAKMLAGNRIELQTPDRFRSTPV